MIVHTSLGSSMAAPSLQVVGTRVTNTNTPITCHSTLVQIPEAIYSSIEFVFAKQTCFDRIQ